MITISKNNWTFYGRLVFFTPLIWLFSKPIQNSLDKQFNGFQIAILIFFLIFVIALGLFLFLGLLTQPILVTIDNNKKQIGTKTIISGFKTFFVSDIKGYSLTTLWTKFKDYPGIILYLQDNTKIELTEFNLKSLTLVKEYLKTQQIKYLGNEKSWFPFRPFKYQYDNKP